MVQGSSTFTPRQLLEAGHRAEAEGKLDLAQQFYGHLSDRYAHTSEATEGRNGLIRIGAFGAQPQVWQTNGSPTAGLGPNGRAAIGRERDKRVRYATGVEDYRNYRIGRVLAALVSGVGWLAMSGALLVIVAVAAVEFAQVPVLQPYNLSFALLPQAGGALAAGAVTLLAGQLARALFDQASAARQLVALERAKADQR